nr:MAG TPA: adenine-specific methyltransferase [Caudoviricetes sp.]
MSTTCENAPESKEYLDFVEKFKPKKTTDDCYTPPLVYAAVKGWAVKEYGLEGREVVRPFYPGGDYERYDYPENCVVIDNPPFSILSKIIDFYIKSGIDFFLFASSLTLLSTCGTRCNAVITDSSIVYENGAKIRTAFATNLGEYKINVCHELYKVVKEAVDITIKEKSKKLPTYSYPDNVLTSAIIQKIASAGGDLKIKNEDCYFIRALDSQKEKGKALFGGGMLLSERAAAEKAAAEKWTLSERELEIIRGLGAKNENVSRFGKIR